MNHLYHKLTHFTFDYQILLQGMLITLKCEISFIKIENKYIKLNKIYQKCKYIFISNLNLNVRSIRIFESPIIPYQIWTTSFPRPHSIENNTLYARIRINNVRHRYIETINFTGFPLTADSIMMRGL